MRTDPSPSITRTLLFLLWGPLVWGLQFALSYGGHTLLCAQGASSGSSRMLVAGLALLALISIAPVALRCWAVAARAGLLPADGFVIRVARFAAILSLIAIPWTAAGALLLRACVVGR